MTGPQEDFIIALGERVGKNRQDILALASRFYKRTFTRFDQITNKEASEIIDYLKEASRD